MLNGGKRVVLTAIEPNEPVLISKITRPGQRATLSAMLRDGMKAVDHPRQRRRRRRRFRAAGRSRRRRADAPGRQEPTASNDLVLQNVRVLAIDQIADERADKPTVVKAVTLEVDMVGAQKLSLASSVGSLSLMLRKAGEAAASKPRQITLERSGRAERRRSRNRRCVPSWSAATA